MKLNEIIDTKRTQDKVDRPSKRDMERNPIGSYSYVKMKRDKDNPHVVKKFSKNAHTSEHDPFATYVEIIVREELWAKSVNFPRIYEINTSDDFDGPALDWTMERLIPFSRLDENEIQNMILRYFEGSRIEPLKDLDITNEESLRRLVIEMCDWFDHYVQGSDNPRKDMTLSKNEPQLQFALDKLRSIKKKHGFVADIHEDNVMYRRGSIGLQIVFNDPFSD